MFIMELSSKYSIDPTVRLRILRIHQLTEKLGLSKSTVYSRMDSSSRWHDPDFPRPIQLGCTPKGRGSVGWIESEVNEYLALCAQRSRNPQINGGTQPSMGV